MSTTADYLQDLITIKNDIITSIIQIGGTASPNEGLCDIVNSIQDIPTPSSAYAFLHVQSEIDATIELSKNSQLIETKTITSTKVIFDIPESGVYTITAKKSGSTDVTSTVSIVDRKAYTISLTFLHTYGVEWDKTDSTLTRTDDASYFTSPDPYIADGSHPGSSPFDNAYPWNEMTIETINGNVMVKIPKFYYKWSNTATNGTGVFKLQISNMPQTGFTISPAHRARVSGDSEKDYVYIARYHCDSNYKSTSGSTPKASISIGTARTNCTSTYNNGNFYQFDMSLLITIWMLYIVEFANWDSQNSIGYGCGTGSKTQASGASDSMPYHTGTMKTSRSDTGFGVQYRNIEDLWGNVCDWIDGISFSSSTIYLYSTFANYGTSTRVNAGKRPTTSTGYINDFNFSTVSGYEWFMFPSLIESSANHVPDHWSYSSGTRYLRIGGSYYTKTSVAGLFCLYNNAQSTTSLAYCGCRLQYIPG